MEKENREHKDSLFVDLFYQDVTAKRNLLSLYNALHDTDYQDEDIVYKIKIEEVLYKNFKNDISFEVNGQVLVFGEHQSTVNPNMPLRCLLYVGRAYEQLVDKKARYRTKLVKIPTPEFYTFYNGKQEGIFLTGRIFQTVKRNPDLTSGQAAEKVGCSVEEVESTRKMFGI